MFAGAPGDPGTPSKRPAGRIIPSKKLVRLAGIEPTTPWFVAKYSIQLSYSRKDKHYSIVDLFPEEQNHRLISGPEGLVPEEAAL